MQAYNPIIIFQSAKTSISIYEALFKISREPVSESILYYCFIISNIALYSFTRVVYMSIIMQIEQPAKSVVLEFCHGEKSCYEFLVLWK